VTIRRVLPNFVAEDLERSRAFYVDVLGFEAAMDEEGFTMYRSPSNPTAQLTLWRKEGPRLDVEIKRAHASIEVEDVDAAYAECVGRGMPIVYPLTDEPWGIRRFFVEDPDGTVLNVTMHV
jgi:catechol 2,3-dioxygenase-like lactoylglutathione lyase family enzyme